MNKFNVLVVTDGVFFKAFHKNKRLKRTILPEKNQGESSHGNPFNIFGDILQEWLMASKYDMTIDVAHISSGNLRK